VKEGTSVIKENAVTATSSIAESCGEGFKEFYPEVANILIEFLVTEVPKDLKQFKGQLIEALTIISISVEKEVMMPFSQKIIEGLLWI
jgi:hypothetical protein